MTIEFDKIGERERNKKATFTIQVDVLQELKNIAREKRKKISPIVNDLIKTYVEQQKKI